jgi:hypothetical protein
VATPVDATITGMPGGAALIVNDVKLAMGSAFVGPNERVEGILRRNSLVEQFQPTLPPSRIGQSLAGKRTDVRSCAGTYATHTQVASRDHYPEKSGFMVSGND